MRHRYRKKIFKNLFFVIWILVVLEFAFIDVLDKDGYKELTDRTDSEITTDNTSDADISQETEDVTDSVIQKKDYPENVQEQNALLPSKYDYRSVGTQPMVRNQELTSYCWAFAAMTALETSKSNNPFEPFSVDHLVYHNTFDYTFNDGGAYNISMAYLLAWRGPVLEKDDAFDGNSPDAQLPVRHVQEILLEENKDYDVIKQFVYYYGGVETSLYVDFNDVENNSEFFYDDTDSFCYTGDKESNHDVVVIGWDDDYPLENFHGSAENNGAFICQSSWGTSFGEDGVFYVSYEDVNIGNYGVVYSGVDNVDNYDFIYQTDLCGYVAQVGYEQEEASFANVYTAAQNINLKAAGFYATGPDTEYEVYLDRNYSSETGPDIERAEYITGGTLRYEGYYTIDFPNSIPIDQKQQYAIIVKIRTPGAKYPIAVECRVEGFTDYADVSDGEGYLSLKGLKWERAENAKASNVCLKAYADYRSVE